MQTRLTADFPPVPNIDRQQGLSLRLHTVADIGAVKQRR